MLGVSMISFRNCYIKHVIEAARRASLRLHNRTTQVWLHQTWRRPSSGPRFARFAAAVEADPTRQAQLLKGPSQSQRRAHPMAASSIRPVKRVRILSADPVKATPVIHLLGIGSWASFCIALFVSLCSHIRAKTPLITALVSRPISSCNRQSWVMFRQLADLMPLPSNTGR
jgi:hypothetical protein